LTSNISAKARAGTKILALRNAVTQVLRIASSVVVARWLSPEDFGLFAILIYISGLPIYLQGLGLGSALVQQREEPTQEQWSSVFFLQLFVAVLLFAGVALGGTYLLRLFGAPAGAYSLLLVAAVPSLIASLGFYQKVWLQRHLEFKKLALVTFLSDVVSVLALCAFAIAGLGVWTLVLAPAIASAVQLPVLFSILPWRPRMAASIASVRPLLRVGAPMQINVALPVVLDGWMPFYTNRLLGVDPLGFLNLAQRLASIPSSYLQILNQVALPSFSRLQSVPEEMLHRLRAVLHRLAILCGCGYVIAAPWMPDIVASVYGERWRSAGTLLQYLGISIVFVAMAGVISPALNALGRHWLRTVPVLVSYGLAWGLGWLVIGKSGAIGLGLTIILVAATQVVGVAFCLPPGIAHRSAIIANVMITAVIGVSLAIAIPLVTHAGLIEKMAVSISGAFIALMVLAVEKWRGYETTLAWTMRMVKPQADAV
jgi:O-antigen/teichoic acid export membrane protein